MIPIIHTYDMRPLFRNFPRKEVATALTWLILWNILTASCSNSSNLPNHRPTLHKSDYTDEAIRWADSTAATLSDDEIAGQMVMPALYASSDSATLHQLRFYTDSLHLGGIMLLKGDTASATKLSLEIRCRSRLIPFVALDAEWGLGMRLKDSPSYSPFGRIPAQATDVELYDYGYEIGRQAPRYGINVIFAPVLDVAISKQSPVALRSLGPDPERVAELGTAFARGLEDGNVISVAKHFPGLGNAMVDSHKARPIVETPRHILDSINLYPFTRYINMGLSGIMVGHVAMTALDTIVRSAAVSPMVIQHLLRDEMNFHGLVFTDAFNMQGLGTVESPYKNAILAGADIIVAPPDTKQAVIEISSAIKSGEIPRNIIDQSIRRILFFKYRLDSPRKKCSR